MTETVRTMDSRILSLVFDSWNKPIVFVDTDHIIQYVNSPAKRHYSKWGDIVGKSIFHCHNADSRGKIEKAFLELVNGEREVMIVDSGKHRVFMRAVKDEEGRLIGYYERYEPPNQS